jgi:pheromone shutdown protein TraB
MSEAQNTPEQEQAPEQTGETSDISVTRVQLQDREIVILGTAHVSRQSVEDVDTVLDSEAPDQVCVELDEARHRSLTQASRWNDLNI